MVRQPLLSYWEPLEKRKLFDTFVIQCQRTAFSLKIWCVTAVLMRFKPV